MTRPSVLATIGIAAGLFAVIGLEAPAQQRATTSTKWVTAWSTSQQNLGMTTVSNATVRMIARVTASGQALRIRLDNTFGTSPLLIRKIHVGPRIQGAIVATGSNKQVFFDGSPSVTIPAGGTTTSDSVEMSVLAQQDVAVSLYIPDSVRPSQHTNAQVTSYSTPNGSGDFAADEGSKPFTTTTTSLFWLKAIDVLSASSTGTVVVFGDSITDGTCSTVDAHDRWEDLVAVRLGLEATSEGRQGAHKAIVNEGIGGNTITREHLQPPPDSPPGLERLDRDVLSHHGVSHVILFMGTNDIRREASARQVIAGIEDMVSRVRARGLKIVGATIIPRHNRPPVDNNTGWNVAKTRLRNEINQWIRAKAGFDAVLDFDTVVQDPHDGDAIYPPFNCGDGIHPSPRGYFEMGKSVRLDFFK
ncbi:MAG: GDSL-type esterase/lipase family protein [Vicinamibacterales bacterium]